MRIRRALFVSALVLPVLLCAAPPVGAAEEAAADPVATVLELHVIEPLQPELPYRVGATLRTAEGTPVPGATVRFSVVTTLLGGRQAALGSGTTDATGLTNVPIEPRDARLEIVARFSGDDAHAPVETASTIEFPADAVVGSGALHETHSLLAPIRSVMPVLISALVAALWVFLIGVALWAVRRIRREGTSATREAGA